MTDDQRPVGGVDPSQHPVEPAPELRYDALMAAASESADAPAATDGSQSAGAADLERVASEPLPDGSGKELPAADPPLSAVVESVLLVTDVPVPSVTLAQVVDRPTVEVEAVLHALAQEYTASGRGFELRQVAGGWRFYTRTDCAPYVERYILDGQQARLTQAALETLAVIAYRQPVTRQRVSAVRGVNVDGVVRTLVARGLVVEAGPDEDTGATRYRTTHYLLERLGLQSLDELPSLAPLLPEVDELTSDSSST